MLWRSRRHLPEHACPCNRHGDYAADYAGRGGHENRCASYDDQNCRSDHGCRGSRRGVGGGQSVEPLLLLR